MNCKQMTCILCPTGCLLTVEWTAAPQPVVKRVRGAMCLKGRDYAIEEIIRPLRTLTTTILVTRGIRRLTSVRTAAPIPKKSIPHALRELKVLAIPAPVYRRQIVMEDVAGTGISVVATRDVEVRGNYSGARSQEPESRSQNEKGTM